MAVNVKLLKKVRKLIAEEPRRLRMRTWGFRHKRAVAAKNPSAYPPCGTVACLAGHIILATKPKRDWFRLFDGVGSFRCDDGCGSVGFRAAALIGIDVNDCPFDKIEWGEREVLAWIDRQIDAAR